MKLLEEDATYTVNFPIPLIAIRPAPPVLLPRRRAFDFEILPAQCLMCIIRRILP